MISQHKMELKTKENPFSIISKKINSNKVLTKDIMEKMDLDPLEEIIEREGRSQSHFVFQFRPEHVPKPKPKKSFVQPTPMVLCLKSIQEVETPSFNLKNQGGDPYLSCPDSESQSESDISTEEAEEISLESNILNQRKELNRLRSKILVINNSKAKDCDSIERKEKKLLDRVMEEAETPNRLSLLFSRSIRTIIKKEKEECKRMTIGPSTCSKSGLSLLKILEISAEKVAKKDNNNNNVKYAQIQSRLKRSSTIV